MSKWNVLSNAVREVIHANGNREITGQVLQNALLNIISNLGNFASFAGVATPSTNPGTPDGPVYYFATQAGTYTNFGALVLDGSCYVLYWNGTAWSSTKIDLPTTAELTSAMNSLIATESTARQQADASLESAIAAEATRAAGKEGETQKQINEMNELSKVVLESGKYIPTTQGAEVPDAETNSAMDCTIIEVSKGDLIEYHLKSDISAKCYAKVSGNLIVGVSTEAAGTEVYDSVTCDGTFDKLIINTTNNINYSVVRSKPIQNRMANAEQIVAKLNVKDEIQLNAIYSSGYLSADGITIKDSTTRSCSDFVELPDGILNATVKDAVGVYKSGWNCAFLYDTNKDLISAIYSGHDNDTPVTLNIGVPATAKYIRTNCNTNNPCKISTEIVAKLNVKDEIQLNAIYSSGYLSADGITIKDSTTRSCSDFVELPDGISNVTVKDAVGVYNSGWNCAFLYDTNKDLISAIYSGHDEDTPVTLNIDVPATAKYIRTICNTNNPCKISTEIKIAGNFNTIISSYLYRWYSAPNYGKTLAVFGGSFSVIPASNTAKDYWRGKLGLAITNYGVGGAGFRKSTGNGTNNIMRQVDRAIASGNTYDIWLLWASTNDFWGGANYIGNENYYIDSSFSAPTYQNGDTDENGVDILDTQCGGMNYCIYRILNYQPTAKIMLFTSIRAMSTDERGYNPKSEHPGALVKYVAGQIAVAEKWGIPYLNQFLEFDINPITKSTYIASDNLHPNTVGYNYFKNKQVGFLAVN